MAFNISTPESNCHSEMLDMEADRDQNTKEVFKKVAEIQLMLADYLANECCCRRCCCNTQSTWIVTLIATLTSIVQAVAKKAASLLRRLMPVARDNK